jgi:uncharacterized protein involved in exopolysaccharide biosynthesis
MHSSARTASTITTPSPDSQRTFVAGWDESANADRTLLKLRLLWEHRASLWRWTIIGLIVSIAMAFLVPAGYKTTAQLMPPDPQTGAGLAMLAALTGGGGNGGGGLTSIATDLLGVKTSGSLFISVLQSRTVEDRIVDRFNLRSVYWKNTRQGARKKLGDNTEMSEDRKSGVITLSVVDHDPTRAATIAGAYIDQLNLLLAQLNTSAAHRERVFLEGRLNQVTTQLEGAEKEFSKFSSKNAAIDISAQGKAMVEGAAEIQGDLIAAESELEGLRQIYSDNNVRVRSIQARIAELRVQLTKLGGKYDANNSSYVDSTSSDDSYPTLRQLPILGVPYADKYRQLKVNEAIFETLTKQYELAKVEEAKEIPSVKVLDPPDIPERRSSPPRTLIIIAGTLCATGLAATWILGVARWNSLDPTAPGTIFVNDVVSTMRSKFARSASTNGAHPNGVGSSKNGAGGAHGQD